MCPSGGMPTRGFWTKTISGLFTRPFRESTFKTVRTWMFSHGEERGLCVF